MTETKAEKLARTRGVTVRYAELFLMPRAELVTLAKTVGTRSANSSAYHLSGGARASKDDLARNVEAFEGLGL